ncbi:hypothetical protein PFISCL1PPCAC_294, partial [Pristionchus fissidentatus]
MRVRRTRAVRGVVKLRRKPGADRRACGQAAVDVEEDELLRVLESEYEVGAGDDDAAMEEGEEEGADGIEDGDDEEEDPHPDGTGIFLL